MPSIIFFEPLLVAEIDNVFGCIKSFSKSTSCGRDGLRAQHILDALCGEGSTTVIDLLKVTTSVINLWLTGRCSPILAEFVASVPLTPILKPNNRIRPIAAGTIWRRLVSKVAMKGVGIEIVYMRHTYLVCHWGAASCKLLLHAWYLDDGTVIGDSKEAIIGCEAYWGDVSRDANFISGLTMRRATNVVDLMSLLSQLHDP
nr:putative reverse transcriptase domain-containing protein [Tanacetum cinerariifolium]